MLPHAARELRDEILFRTLDVRLGPLRELEHPERLLELLPYACERRMRVRRDHRPDVLEREPDRPCLQRCQPRRQPERVAPELLVDVDRAVAQLRVDRVATAA